MNELIGDTTLAKLNAIFQDVLKRQEEKVDPIRSKFGKIEKEEINIEDHMIFLEEYAMLHKKFSFRKVLENGSGKSYVIVTFLGILEMMKTGKFTIEQDKLFDDIIITYNPGKEHEEYLFLYICEKPLWMH